jgi:DNA-binding Lrp family transcriptional regulator
VIGARALPKIDQKDATILRMLSLDARAPLSKISKEVGLSAGAVRYRIDRLVEKKVITGFRPVVDMTRIGYTSYKIRFHLNSFESQEKLEQFARKKASHITKTICGGDFEMRMYAKNHKELLSTIYEIRDEFSDQIQDYDVLEYPEVVKTQFMPDF